MKYLYINKAAQLADERDDLMKLRSAAMTNTVTIAAGASPIAIDSMAAAHLLDELLNANETALKELGVTEAPRWQVPQRPVERSA